MHDINFVPTVESNWQDNNSSTKNKIIEAFVTELGFDVFTTMPIHIGYFS